MTSSAPERYGETLQGVSGQPTGHHSHYCRCCDSRNMRKDTRRERIPRKWISHHRPPPGYAMWLPVLQCQSIDVCLVSSSYRLHPGFRGGSEEAYIAGYQNKQNLWLRQHYPSSSRAGEVMAAPPRWKSICDRSSRTVSLTSGASCFVLVCAFCAARWCVSRRTP